MTTQTNIRLAIALAVVLLGGAMPRAEATVTMTNNVLIGNAIVAVTPTASGATTNIYTYDFAGDSLAMAGYKIYHNTAQLNVVLTNLTGVADSGAGSIDTSSSSGGSGYIRVYCSGAVQIGGNILSTCGNGAVGAITVAGNNDIRVGGNIVADYTGGGVATYLSPVAISGSGAVRVDGYVSASHTVNNGIITGTHSVQIQGASVTVGGTNSAGYSVLAMNECGNEVADNIVLIATNGDITVAGGYDAHGTDSSRHRYVTNIASGNITIGSLNASKFKAITLIAGQTATNWIYVTGVLTNFTKTESPKKLTFPSGSVVSNNIYYHPVNNGAGLTGEYSIYVSTSDTGKKLIDGPPPAPGGNPPIVVNMGATNFTDTTASLSGWMAATGSAESVTFLYWSTTDGTTNESSWLAGGSVSNLGVKAKGEVFTNTIAGLSANTRYFYNHMGSNSVGKGWAATNGSPSFRTDGPPVVGTGVGATVVGAYSATLNGTLTDTLQARVFVYYGTDFNNWAYTNDLGWRGTGTFSTAASGLSQNTLYYYQCRATNIYGNVLSDVASFTTKIPATTNMTGDVLIGNALAGIAAVGATPYTYDFGAYLTLDMGGYKLYRNDAQRDVRVINVLGIANGGSVDTSRSGNNNTGYIEIDATGPVVFANNLTARNGANAATGRIRVNATDIRVGGSVLTDNASTGGQASGPVTLTATAGDVAITNCIATYNHGGGVSVNAGAVALTATRVTIGGTNSYGHAIDAHGGSAAGQHIGGGAVTIKATSGVTLSTGGISTYGAGGGAVTISDGAGGSAGDITIGGNVLSYNNEGKSLPGAQTLRGANIRVTGYMDADQKGAGVVTPAFAPIAIVGSGSVRVDGYVTASRTGDSGIMTGDHSVRIQGASVTVNGTSGGYSVLAMNACVTAGEKADNITLIATNGDITVAGGYDASAVYSGANFGTVTNIASGKIVIGSLNAARFKSISLQPGGGKYGVVYVTGVLTNFPVSESPKTFTFPAGSFVGNDVYYEPASNTAIGLTGEYAIYVSTSNTTWKLKEGPPLYQQQGTVLMVW